jgi:predicted 2-oxoglutarate/Fe(II)-dependent dioxygenase YbiX
MKVRTISIDGFYPSQNVTDVFVIEGFLDPDECREARDRLELADKTLRVDDRFRSNDRVTLMDNFSRARKIFDRLRRHTDLFYEEGFMPVGCNPRFHVYSYSKPGDQFTLHADQPYILDDMISFYTVLVYLSDEYEGGEALIGGTEKFKPSAGTAVVFPHYILHGAAPLISGSRHTMRTDVMYRSAKLGQVHNLGRDEVLP